MSKNGNERNRRLDFRKFMEDTIVQRCKKNPKYSLRAFARSVGVNHAHLSLILRGVRPVTGKLTKKIGTALGLGPYELAKFLPPHQSANARELVSLENSALQVLEADRFELISAWHHDAIMELARLPTFEANPQWIARRLNINAIEASVAFRRLIRLGLIVIDEYGKLAPDFLDTTTNVADDVSTAALREYQKTILQKSIEALENLPRAVRDHTSLTLAISKRDLTKAKKIIADFRVRLMEALQRRPEAYDEVYQLSVSMFPLTKFENEVQSTTRKASSNRKESSL